MRGVCFRNERGEMLDAVVWTDGKDVSLQILLSTDGTYKSIVLTGQQGWELGSELMKMAREGELSAE